MSERTMSERTMSERTMSERTMSERMQRRLDTIAAYGRWIALLAVVIATFVSLPLEPDSIAWTVLIVTAVMAVIDAIPVVLLYFHLFPDYAAIIFAVLDGIYALALIYMGGSSLFFYAFISALTLCARSDWAAGFIASAVLAAGNILLALIRVNFASVGEILPVALFQSLELLIVSGFGGFLTDSLKKEPPLEDAEMQTLQTRLRNLQSAVDQSRAIYEMASMLGATLNPDRILDAVLEITAVGFEELDGQAAESARERPAGAVFLFGQQGLYVATARNLPNKESELTVDGDEGLLFTVLSKAEPTIAGGLGSDRELRKYSPFRRSRSAICVPLRAGFELYGAILFASPKPKAYSEEHLEMLTAVSNQAAVALNNAQLYRDIQEEKEKVLETSEEERSKLARDLHDGPTQSISAIAMRLNFARLLVDREPEKVKDELFKLENLARRTTKEIRTMLFTLRPVVLVTQGLKAAVEQLVEKHKETGDLPVSLEIEEDIEEQVDVNVKAVAWFITQEALNNAKKYADAENIWVRMYIRDERFVAEIEDDGAGFDYEATMANYDQRGSFGLRNYQERADLVNGRSLVRSALGKGTKVTLIVPLNQQVI